jgi:hypothetical protein
MEMVKLDYYSMRFKEKKIDELYDAYYLNDIGVYIAKIVQRRPYVRVEPTPSGEPDKPVEFDDVVYFSDVMLDMTQIKVLNKRANLVALLNIGNYNYDSLTSEFKDSITTKLNEAASYFSDKYYVEQYNAELYLQRKEDSDTEDQVFTEIQEAIILKKKMEKDADLARVNSLIARENKVKADEALISTENSRLVVYAQDLDTQVAILNERKDDLDILEDSLNVKAENLAQKEYELKIREQRVYNRENALGLPHTL